MLKAEPLTVDEVNKYGKDHVNRYTDESVGTAYNKNGYGGMQYYSSGTCGYVNSSWVSDGCTTEYAQSEIKYVVDNWAKDKFQASDLKEDNLGYKARLITFEELTTNLGYDKNAGGCIQPSTNGDTTPDWVYNSNYWYWTMSTYNDSASSVWRVSSFGNVDGRSVNDYLGVVRPVVNLKKSVIE